MANPIRIENDSGFMGLAADTQVNIDEGPFEFTDSTPTYWRYVWYTLIDVPGKTSVSLAMARTADGITFTKLDQSNAPLLGAHGSSSNLSNNTVRAFKPRD